MRFESWFALLVTLAVAFSSTAAVGFAAPTGSSPSDLARSTADPVGVADGGSVHDAGTVHPQPSDADGRLDGNASLFYLGMDLLTTAAAPGEPLDLYRVGPDGGERFVERVVADEHGTAVVRTDGARPGIYRLRGDDGSLLAQFRLIEQRLTVGFNRSSVGVDDPVALSVSSNRKRYELILRAVSDDGPVLPSVLNRFFDGAGRPRDLNGDGTNDSLVVDGPNRSRLVDTFDDTVAGDLRITARVADTGIYERATVSVLGIGEHDVDPADADARLDGDRESFYAGMDLLATGGAPTETVELYRVGDDGTERFVDVAFADRDGEALVDTDGYRPGTYRLRDGDGNRLRRFRLSEQRLIASFDRTSVAADERVSVAITSNRRGYPLIVRATADGHVVPPPVLAGYFGGSGRPVDVDGDGRPDAVRLNASNVVQGTVSLDGVATDELTVTATAEDTGVTDEATVRVARSGSVARYAEDGVVTTVGLSEAIADWVDGELSTIVLQRVIDAWTSGTPVD